MIHPECFLFGFKRQSLRHTETRRQEQGGPWGSEEQQGKGWSPHSEPVLRGRVDVGQAAGHGSLTLSDSLPEPLGMSPQTPLCSRSSRNDSVT